MACIVLCLISTSAFSGNLAVESETVVRSFKRVTGPGANEQVAPVYEYLKLDVEQLGFKNLSFHTYGWGRLDAADSGYYDHSGSGELIYGYLEYADGYQDMNVRLGRQHVFEGVANDAIDGLRVRSDLGSQFSISGYGGVPVGFDETDGRGGDSIWGGRLSHRFKALSDVGVSYKRIRDNSTTVSSMLGIDSAFFLPWDMSLSGRSARNMETAGWAEHNYELQICAGDFTICPLYELFQYDQYFGAMVPAAGPFLSLAESDEQLRVIGADIDWRFSRRWSLGVKAKDYSYNLAESAMYVSASVSWLGESLTQAGGEVGHMQGGAADNNYLLMRLFFYLDGMAESVWADFVSADILYTLYDEDIYGKNYSYCVSFSSGRSFYNDKLEVKLSADYSVDPYFDSDLRAMLAVVYRFSAGF